MDATVPASYVPTAGRFDELVDDSGTVRPHWESMVRTWSTLGADEIVRRQMVAERLLVAEGAGHVFHDDREVGMPWGLDPVPYVIGATRVARASSAAWVNGPVCSTPCSTTSTARGGCCSTASYRRPR